jgi:hypothetical protein
MLLGEVPKTIKYDHAERVQLNSRQAHLHPQNPNHSPHSLNNALFSIHPVKIRSGSHYGLVSEKCEDV